MNSDVQMTEMMQFHFWFCILQQQNRNLFVTVTPKGRELYRDYSRFIYERWFRDMFKLADQIPEEHLKIFEDILQGFADTLVWSILAVVFFGQTI